MITDAATYLRTLDCVHCGLCLQACPTYDLLGLEPDSPRGRLHLMRAYHEGRIEDPDIVARHLDRCLDCRACETACPSGVQYGAILEHTRAALRGRLGPKARLRRFLLTHLLPRRRLLRWTCHGAWLAESIGLRWLATKLHLLPAPMAALAPAVPAPRARVPLAGIHRPTGTPRGRVGFFLGCVMEQLFPEIHSTTLEVLVANGFEVVIPRGQTCCGALLVHDGHPDRARPLARRNAAAFADCDIVINNAAGCGAALGEYGALLGDEEGAAFAAKNRDVSSFLFEVGLTAPPAPRSMKIAYDDPCHLCHGQGVRRAPRELLAQVPGLELITHRDPEGCCGSAGIYNMLQPDIAGPLGERKAADLIDSGAQGVATGNPGCMLQIRAHLEALGTPLPVYHPIELLRPATGS